MTKRPPEIWRETEAGIYLPFLQPTCLAQTILPSSKTRIFIGTKVSRLIRTIRLTTLVWPRSPTGTRPSANFPSRNWPLLDFSSPVSLNFNINPKHQFYFSIPTQFCSFIPSIVIHYISWYFLTVFARFNFFFLENSSSFIRPFFALFWFCCLIFTKFFSFTLTLFYIFIVVFQFFSKIFFF